MWRLAASLDHVASDVQDGAPLETPFFEAALDYISLFVDRMHHPKEDDFLFRLLRSAQHNQQRAALPVDGHLGTVQYHAQLLYSLR